MSTIITFQVQETLCLDYSSLVYLRALRLNFWTAFLNLRSYHLTSKIIPLFPWGFLDYSFHAFINIDSLLWYTSFKIG